MAKGQISVNKEPQTVYCGECRHFHRDTEGTSFRIETGEFFMGVCGKGLKPDTVKKQFADKPRRCKSYDGLR